MHTSALILASSLLAGCAPDLAPGEWGTFRYFGELRGEPPMQLLPPITDRAGNAYVLFGARDITENSVYIGSALGGWSGGCQVHRGSFGVHGFVGRAEDRAWFWSGDALGLADGGTGSCRELLRTDPVTGTELSFIGVAPYVFETPSRTRLLALVRGATDDTPFYVRVDLDQETYLDPRVFEPTDAQDITVLGTGADPVTREGIFVLSYTSGGRQVVANFVDESNGVTASARLDGFTVPDAYSLQGFVQVSDAGLAAALTTEGQLLIFNRSSGGLKDVTGFTPQGLIRWDGELYVTGLQQGVPVVAQLDGNGTVGAPQRWTTAEAADNALNGTVVVRDERSDPTREASWQSPTSAPSDLPFMTPWPVDVYTAGSTGWLVAGPAYSVATEPFTAVAFAPVGFAVP